MGIVSRTFKVVRHNHSMDYIFQTYDTVVPENYPDKSNHQKLAHFICEVLNDGYPSRDGKSSISDMPKYIRSKPKKIHEKHIFTELAKRANYRGRGKLQHDTVQSYFLRHCPITAATELPVWTNGCHGHIDIVVFLPDDKIGILDFKPNARRETKAECQIERYAMALTERTRIAFTDIILFYFDDELTYSL